MIPLGSLVTFCQCLLLLLRFASWVRCEISPVVTAVPPFQFCGSSGCVMQNVNVKSDLAVPVTLPPDVEDVARTELGETKETKERCLLRLRQLIASDARLDCPVDDEFLVKFLRGRKYQVEKAFKTIQKYFRVRKTSVDLFKDLLPTAVPLRAILVDNRLMMLSKGRDCLGRPVALIKMGSWHRSICSLDDLYRAALIMAEWALLDEETQIRGVVGVCDLKGLRAHHLAHFTPLSLKKIAHIVQDCYPARVKAIYVINNPPLCELLYAAVKPFLKSKIVQRISFIGHDLKKLHGILPPDVIPVESGGTHEEFDCYSQEKDVRAAQDYFEYIARYGFRD